MHVRKKIEKEGKPFCTTCEIPTLCEEMLIVQRTWKNLPATDGSF